MPTESLLSFLILHKEFSGEFNVVKAESKQYVGIFSKSKHE